jgi:hypothetical protein
MKNLLYKELKLVVHPTMWLYAAMTAMFFIAQYPSMLMLGYGMLSLFSHFKYIQTNKDHEFTIALPVSRNQLVWAKHMTVIFLEVTHIIAAVPFVLIANLLLHPEGNPVGMDANFAFFGLTLILYTVFNVLFLPHYFATGSKAGIPMLLGAAGFVLTTGTIESLVVITPALKNSLDSLDPATFIYQIPVLLGGMVIYAGGIFGSYKWSVRKFDRVNL